MNIATPREAYTEITNNHEYSHSQGGIHCTEITNNVEPFENDQTGNAVTCVNFTKFYMSFFEPRDNI